MYNIMCMYMYVCVYVYACVINNQLIKEPLLNPKFGHSNVVYFSIFHNYFNVILLNCKYCTLL